MTTVLQRLPENTAGRDFATGDIHGCFDRLRALLDRAGFRPDRDRLITPGDMVDRGPDSLQVLDWLDKPWFISSRGNHDQMAINFAAGHNSAFHYERNGGRWFIDLSDGEQQVIAKRFEELPLAIEFRCRGSRYGVVHAEVPGDDWTLLEAAQQLAELPAQAVTQLSHIMLWERRRIDFRDDSTVAGIDVVLVGHTPVRSPFQKLGNVVYLDTGSVFGRPMSLVCLTTGEHWQDQV